jgi:hypothetical protein
MQWNVGFVGAVVRGTALLCHEPGADSDWLPTAPSIRTPRQPSVSFGRSRYTPRAYIAARGVIQWHAHAGRSRRRGREQSGDIVGRMAVYPNDGRSVEALTRIGDGARYR